MSHPRRSLDCNVMPHSMTGTGKFTFASADAFAQEACTVKCSKYISIDSATRIEGAAMLLVMSTKIATDECYCTIFMAQALHQGTFSQHLQQMLLIFGWPQVTSLSRLTVSSASFTDVETCRQPLLGRFGGLGQTLDCSAVPTSSMIPTFRNWCKTLIQPKR